MALADALDSAIGYAFSVTIDGIEVPKVIEVSGIKLEVDKISNAQQMKDGKFDTRQYIGRRKPGSFTVTRGLTDSTTVTDWLKTVMQGDMKGARKTAEVTIYNLKGESLRRINFRDCWVASVELSTMKAAGTEVLTEKFTVNWDEMEFAS
jgi:phage tail-like protein